MISYKTLGLLYFIPFQSVHLIFMCLKRFWHLVDNAIDNNMLAPLSAEWIDHFSGLVPSHLLRLKKAKKEFLEVS